FSDDALVLIYSTIESLEIRSSLGAIDKVSYNASASRYEVLVKPVKQMLFAAKAGFIEAKIATLNPNPKDVFYYKVEEKKVELVQAEPGILTISSNPPGADIFLNGVKIADKTPFRGELNSGSTRIKLKKKKYEEFDTLVQIRSAEEIVFNKSLKSNVLWLNINSNPADASVFFDGAEIGRTPMSKEFELSNASAHGVKSIKLYTPGYDTLNYSISFEPANNPVELNLNLVKQRGQFTITSQPSGADVFIAGVYKGHTPLNGLLELGRYEVYVKLDDYKIPSKKYIDVNANKKAEFDFTLIPWDSSDDPDKDLLQEIKIGQQIWSLNNLNTDRFRNGDTIPEVKSNSAWVLAGENKQPAWCYYDNNSMHGESYGKLYNWYAVADSRGLCPAGWHVPNNAEWAALGETLGGNDKAAEQLNQLSIKEGRSSDSNGRRFNSFPGGIRLSNGRFDYLGNDSYWWTVSDNSSKEGVNRYILHDSSEINKATYYLKSNAHSVKCIKD
ncbi:MAG: FISUMP domain-containing protein, partial [Bacteroidia bacterium]